MVRKIIRRLGYTANKNIPQTAQKPKKIRIEKRIKNLKMLLLLIYLLKAIEIWNKFKYI